MPRPTITSAVLRIEEARAHSPYTSTQENAWLVLAARAITKDSGATMDVGNLAHKGALYRNAKTADLAQPLRVTNTGEAAAQLISRSWNINDANGRTEKVNGLGVIGQQPLLAPGESFRYTSGCRLQAASGTMHGSYFCVAEDGERFEAPIAMFVLDAGSGDAPARRVLH